LPADFSLTDEEGRTVRRYELVRPTRTERHRQDLFAETHWTDVDRASFDEVWQAECDAMAAQTRTQIIYLVTGLLPGLGQAARRSCPGLAADER
jgi:hypothetical protein